MATAPNKSKRIPPNDSYSEEITTYLGYYEREIHNTKPVGAQVLLTKTVHRHTLGGFATYTRILTPTISLDPGAGLVTKLAVILKDHLGSTDCLLTGVHNGSNWGDLTTQRESFDTFSGGLRVAEGKGNRGREWLPYRD